MFTLSNPPNKVKRDVYQIVTDKVLDLLEQGTVPWKKPWRGGSAGMPKNAINKKGYRGINVFMLAVTSEAMGYNPPMFSASTQLQKS